jgi:pimeloyl-ACP methyl ester carboxylesterase
VRALLAITACVFLLISGAAMAQTVVGDWHGTLAVGPGRSHRLGLHIRPAEGGGYSGTLDDLDRAAADLPVTNITLSGDTFTFSAPIKGAPATFDGKWDAASRQWAGEWTQGGTPFALAFSRGAAPPLPSIAGIDGVWDGTLTTPTAKLRMVLHIRTGAIGTAAWLDSTDQFSYGLDATGLHRDDADVGFEMPVLKVVFKGALSSDRQTITGVFTQAGIPNPLTLTRRASGAAAPAVNHPQTSKKPYPYREEAVAFDDAAAHVTLAGTLTLPPGVGPFPAVVLIAGSGANTRDEPILGHQIFLVLADYLTRHGIAVVRYDKRGTGDSTGDYAKATSQDFADDAEAAAAWLRGRREIDPRRVGLIGHSEGGLIAPMVAAHDPKIAFVVMMAGPGVDGLDILTEQGRLIAKAMGLSDADVAASAAFRRQIFDIVRAEKDPERATAKLKVALDAYAKARGVPEAEMEAEASQFNSDWFRFFYDYDPAIALRQLRCPVLALTGSLDLQAPPGQNLPPIRAALAHDPDAEVVELPALNHLFQTARTGSPSEYGQIEETIAPLALATITDWILRHAGGPQVATPG